MITLEKHFQAKLTEWIKKPNNKFNCIYELKISHGNTVQFSAFQEQQLPSLWKARHDVLAVKWSDALGTMKPCDGACFVGTPAYVGIMFNIPKNQKVFYFLPIDDVVKLKKSGAKSITKKFAQKIGLEFVL